MDNDALYGRLMATELALTLLIAQVGEIAGNRSQFDEVFRTDLVNLAEKGTKAGMNDAQAAAFLKHVKQMTNNLAGVKSGLDL